jgi:hypothetical protein
MKMGAILNLGIAISALFWLYVACVGRIGIRCDRIYKDIHKHDDFCYLSFRPKGLK